MPSCFDDAQDYLLSLSATERDLSTGITLRHLHAKSCRPIACSNPRSKHISPSNLAEAASYQKQVVFAISLPANHMKSDAESQLAHRSLKGALHYIYSDNLDGFESCLQIAWSVS